MSWGTGLRRAATALVGVVLLASCAGDDDPASDARPDATGEAAPSASSAPLTTILATTTVPQLLPDPGPALDAWAAEHDVVGAVVLVSDGSIRRVATHGARSVDTGEAIEENDRFAVGSINKTFAAATVMALVETGEVTLDDLVARHLDGAPEDLMLRHLLDHTSGFGDGDLFVQMVSGLFDPSARRTLSEVVADAFTGGPANAVAVNEQYAATNYLIVDEYVAAATGESFESLTTELVIDPLGLDHTGFEADGTNLARPHGRLGTESPHIDLTAFDAAASIRSAGASGALYSTAQDLETFARALFAGDLLSAESVELMTTLQEPGVKYGLGVRLYPSAGGTVFGHNGGTVGSMASLRYDPARGVTVVVLANTNDAPTPELADDLVAAVQGG